MSITPIDILHIEFKPSFRGYNKSQVDEFVKSARLALEDALKDKNELQRKVDMLQEEVDQVKAIKAALTDALTVAQKSADEVRANAHKQAELILKEAEQARLQMNVDAQKEAEKHRADAELVQATRNRFEIEFRNMLKAYLEWLDRCSSDQEQASEVA